MSGGLIDRAFLSGNHDPIKFYKKFPRSTWNAKGGYEIQSTPQEVAAVISESRAWIKGHRMLCVGTETLGAERFIAENLGVLDMDYIGDALPKNISEMKIKVNKSLAPAGKYDLITVYGTAKVDAILPFTKIGTLVIFLGIGPRSNNPALRSAWMGLRKKHMAMYQSGGLDWQVGAGILKILFETKGAESAVEEAKDSGSNPPDMPVLSEPEDGEVMGGVADQVHEPERIVEDVPAVKRRGRQPGSKNKSKEP